MADTLPETAHFGLTRVGVGESSSKNGGSFADLDRLKIDDLLFAALTHTHDGAPALGDPTDPPELVTSPTGGALPAATTYFYRIAYVDVHGLESAASPEATITTPDPLPAPTTPGVVVENAGGNVLPGIYSYLITIVDTYGGETTPSAPTNVQVVGGTLNRLRLNLPDLTGTASYFNIYRARPGQSGFYLIGNSSGLTFYDDGITEDQTIQTPTINTSNAANSVTITVPLGFIPQGCTGWKIYRATSSGGYDGDSLVHQVIEGATDVSTIPVTFWIDTGDDLQPGFPQNQSSTVPSGSLLTLDDLQGTLPIAVIPRGVQCLSAYGGGMITNARVITVTESPVGLQPVRLTAYFATPPDSGTTVRVRVLDSAATPGSVELVCPDSPSGSDPAGYYHLEFPLVAAESFDVALGSRSVAAAVVTDPTSQTSQGQAVELGTNGDWAAVDFGELDSGSYEAFVRLRPILDASITSDVTVSVVRTDSQAVLATETLTVATVADGYREVSLAFTPPGGVAIELRVQKVTTGIQSYNLDLARFTAVVPSLAAGRLVIQTFVDSGPTVAADVNISLWF